MRHLITLVILTLALLTLSCGGGGNQAPPARTPPMTMQPDPPPARNLCRHSACMNTEGLNQLLVKAADDGFTEVDLYQVEVNDSHRRDVRRVLEGALPSGYQIKPATYNYNAALFVNSFSFAAMAVEKAIVNVSLRADSLELSNPVISKILLVHANLNANRAAPVVATHRRVLQSYANVADSKLIVVAGIDPETNILSSDSYPCGSELQENCIVSDYTVDVEGELYSGTSFATPNVTAGLTTVASLFPAISLDDLRRLAFDCAEDLGDPGVDSTYGHGKFSLGCMVSPDGSIGLPDGYANGAATYILGRAYGLKLRQVKQTDSYGRHTVYQMQTRGGSEASFYQAERDLDLINMKKGFFVHSNRSDYSPSFWLGAKKSNNVVGAIILEKNTALNGGVSFQEDGYATSTLIQAEKTINILNAGALILASHYSGGEISNSRLSRAFLWLGLEKQIQESIVMEAKVFGSKTAGYVKARGRKFRAESKPELGMTLNFSIRF